MDAREGRLDLTSVRARLSAASGKEYWRGLEELAESEGVREWLQREFPSHASTWLDPFGRREFLKLMGASLALAGLAGCGVSPAPTKEKIVPYVRQPEEMVPGNPLFFATTVPMAGFGMPVLVESHEGRPTKIEGNPQHPASLGATDVFTQAAILTLYDPDRSQVVTKAGRISTWNAFFNELSAELATQQSHQGAGIRVLTETVTSPTLASQLRSLLAAFPAAKWHQYEPAGRDGARAGARLAFGEDVDPQYRFDWAEVILSLDADFLGGGPGCVRYARDFAGGRRVGAGRTQMNRLYAVESSPSITGTMADHRLALRPSQMEGFARAMAQGLGIEAGGGTGHAKWIAAAVRDLERHRGQSLVVAGAEQPPIVHALAHAMNAALGNAGTTVFYTDPVEANPADHMESLRDLAKDMEAGLVDVLVILGGNPVFTAPADLHFGERLSKVGLRVHLSLYQDETSALCHWHVPAAHPLEAWSDIRAYDGTVTILQPLIAPLYSGRSAHEVLVGLLGQPGTSGHDIVQGYWKGQYAGKDFNLFWRTALHDGLIQGSARPPKQVSLKMGDLGWGTGGSGTGDRRPGTEDGPLEILFRPDPTVFDGRFANNGWLQELPKPLTKLTWDNAALMSPATAERLDLSYRVGTTGGEHGRIYADVVILTYRGRSVRPPAWIVPGHPDDCVTVHLGYGRSRAGRVGTGTGFNAYAIRTSDAPWGNAGLEIRKTGEQYPLACTQFHYSIEGRHLLRSGTVSQYWKNPNFARQMVPEAPRDLTIYPQVPYEGYAWGMAIDLSACTGCSACVVACQAENNSPIVGKEEVTRGREMHWLRVDRYYKGDLANPETSHQPVPCQQCENAPCELVCPTGATNHSAEGLNDMTYNRCVGTRYCSNNCPYKVRRFNFFAFADFETPSLKLHRNPNVTVRSRGVMEKCTYCVQRINAAKIQAEEEGRPVKDGEILTACQQACPTQAIVFGNINDPGSRVAKLKSEPLNYAMLNDFLNTRPRTTYLARLKNPNPEMEAA